MVLEEQAPKAVRLRNRIGIIATGHAAKQVEEFFFDQLVYGGVVTYTTATFGALYGPLITFAIMTPISIVMCLIYIKLYDWAKKDLFGFEAIKSAREDIDGDGFLKRMIRAALRLGDLPAFFILSITSDASFTTIYLRKGVERYDGLRARDRWIFLASVLFSNAYWTLRWTTIVVVLAWAWTYVPEPARQLLLGVWHHATALVS